MFSEVRTSRSEGVWVVFGESDASVAVVAEEFAGFFGVVVVVDAEFPVLGFWFAADCALVAVDGCEVVVFFAPGVGFALTFGALVRTCWDGVWLTANSASCEVAWFPCFFHTPVIYQVCGQRPYVLDFSFAGEVFGGVFGFVAAAGFGVAGEEVPGVHGASNFVWVFLAALAFDVNVAFSVFAGVGVGQYCESPHGVSWV